MTDLDTNDITPDTTDATLIDLDDVEGHGLREVAAGLGAAAVLAGGGSAALASTGVHLPTVHPSNPSVTVQVGDPITTTDKVVDQTLQTTRDLRDGSVAAANALKDDATELAGSTAQGVGSTASGTVTQARGVADGAVETAKQDVKAAQTIARNAVVWTGAQAGEALDTAGDVVKDTQQLATQTVNNAGSTASAAVADTERKAATVLQVATTTAQNGITTLTTTLKSINAGAGADMGSTSAWMTASVDGVVVAQWQTDGEHSTVSFATPVGNPSITVSYLGDDDFAPTQRVVQL